MLDIDSASGIDYGTVVPSCVHPPYDALVVLQHVRNSLRSSWTARRIAAVADLVKNKHDSVCTAGELDIYKVRKAMSNSSAVEPYGQLLVTLAKHLLDEMAQRLLLPPRRLPAGGSGVAVASSSARSPARSPACSSAGQQQRRSNTAAKRGRPSSMACPELLLTAEQWEDVVKPLHAALATRKQLPYITFYNEGQQFFPLRQIPAERHRAIHYTEAPKAVALRKRSKKGKDKVKIPRGHCKVCHYLRYHNKTKTMATEAAKASWWCEVCYMYLHDENSACWKYVHDQVPGPGGVIDANAKAVQVKHAQLQIKVINQTEG